MNWEEIVEVVFRGMYVRYFWLRGMNRDLGVCSVLENWGLAGLLEPRLELESNQFQSDTTIIAAEYVVAEYVVAVPGVIFTLILSLYEPE